jgi:phosphate transport system substrate-binding protein
MNKFMRAVGLAALPALLVTACSGGTTGTGTLGQGLPSAPSTVRTHDAGPQDLHSGGSTFAAYAYNLGSQPAGLASGAQAGPGAGSLFASAGTTGTIYYCLTGSGAGRKSYDGATPTFATSACAALGLSPTGLGGEVDPPDFVGSDVGLSSTEYTTYKTNREPSSGTNYGEPFQFPALGGAVVYGYSANSFPKLNRKKQILHLSEWSQCAIANGTITNWNDKAITADNGGVSVTGGKSAAITFYFRSDSSGTTSIFTTHLATICTSSWLPPYSKPPYQTATRNAAWTYGASSTWPGPGSSNHPNPHFIAASGNPGVLAGVQAKVFNTGYVEGAFARAATHPAVYQAWLQNSQGYFSDPTVAKNVAVALSKVQLNDVTFGMGADLLPLATSRPECVFFVNPSVYDNPPEAHAYPLVGLSYLMFYGNNNGVHVADKVKLINYIMSPAGNTVLGNLEYTPIAKGLQNGVLAATNGTGAYAGKPCIQ